MSTYEGREGVWCTYAYLNETFRTVYILRVYNDIVPAARACAKERNGSVLFWPYTMDLVEALTWWSGNPSEEPKSAVTEQVEEDGKIHLYPVHSDPVITSPICVVGIAASRVMLNRNAIGPICQKCQDAIGRTIT